MYKRKTLRLQVPVRLEFTEMLDLGKHAVFIWSSYAIVFATLVFLIAWLVAEGRQLSAQMADFEARGIKRRQKGQVHK